MTWIGLAEIDASRIAIGWRRTATLRRRSLLASVVASSEPLGTWPEELTKEFQEQLAAIRSHKFGE